MYSKSRNGCILNCVCNINQWFITSTDILFVDAFILIFFFHKSKVMLTCAKSLIELLVEYGIWWLKQSEIGFYKLDLLTYLSLMSIWASSVLSWFRSLHLCYPASHKREKLFWTKKKLKKWLQHKNHRTVRLQTTSQGWNCKLPK